MANPYLMFTHNKLHLIRLSVICSLLIVLTLFTLSLAQTETKAEANPLPAASIADECLATFQSVQDTHYSELQQFDSQHAAMLYLYTSDQVHRWLKSGAYLETAIHESNHHLNRLLSRECEPLNKRKYFLIGRVYETDLQVGETLSIGIINQTVPTSLQSSRRYEIYISANPNVRKNTLSSLLDELTAYTGESWVNLQKVENLVNSQVSDSSLNYSQFQIDGMVNFMLYLQAYLKSARLYYPDAYTKIQSKEKTLAYIAELWKQSEDILVASYPHIQNDRAAQHFFFKSDGAASALEHLKQVYSTDMLTELDHLSISHLTFEDIENTYF